MKKNITINLCGRLFQIDEDAYEMLRHYTDSLRSHFARQAEGDEIVNDIEERIAELLDELKANGTEAITIDHVKDIITRIGKPEQLAGDTEDTQEDAEEETTQQTSRNSTYSQQASSAPKRLFRNPKDKMVAGVLSGLAAYTGTDALFWRLATVVFTFFYGGGLLIYIILAIIMPEARTPEQLLQMRGKAVNPQNLADMMVDEKQANAAPRSGLRDVVSLMLKAIIGFFVVIAAIIGFLFAIAFLGVLTTVVFAIVMPAKSAISLPFTLSGMGLTEVWADHPAVLILFAVALLATLFIPVYAIIHMILSLTKKIKPMSVTQRIVWLVLWIIALCATIPLGGSISMLHDQYSQERKAEEGFWMTDFDRNYLNKYGLKVTKNQNCHDDYVNLGEYFTGDKGTAYLNVWNEDAVQVFEAISNEKKVEAGTYRISCNARAEGEGVYLFAVTAEDSSRPAAMTMVPVYGNEGGQLWEEACNQTQSDSLPVARRARQIREANNGKGYGWSPVEIEIQIDEPTTLRYGITTDPSFTDQPYSAKWFSASDFKMEKVTQ